MFKSNKGFTLVELIVVIAILAILAGVAVPAYTGYITRANDAAIITELDAIKTAVQATYATKEMPTEIIVTESTVMVGTEDLVTNGSDFMTFYGKNTFSIDFDDTSYEGKNAKWANNEWTAVNP